MTPDHPVREIYCPICDDPNPHRWLAGYGNLCACLVCRTVRLIHGPHSEINPDHWKNFLPDRAGQED